MARPISALLAGALVCATALLATNEPALAWGTKGHTMINRLAAASLPSRLPAFMRTAAAADELAFLGPEEDALKGSGRAWDAQYDPGHYLDVLDDGTIAGALKLGALPETQETYDTALRASGSDQYKTGYLPYAILDGWEQLRMDFAYWRVDAYRATHDASAARRRRAASDRAIEEQLILRDAGVWGHFVGDASQPLHVTVHFNGWGEYPNPKGYSTSRDIHAFFESTFVNRYAQERAVAGLMAAPAPRQSAALATQEEALGAIESYLQATNATVTQLYSIDKAGGFVRATPQAVTFCDARLAAGAAELRDLTAWAWDDSINESVGYPAQPVRTILNATH